MDEKKIKKIIDDIKSGKLNKTNALEVLKKLPYQDLGFAKIDHHRVIRKGFPEVIYGKGKTAAHILEIIEKLTDHNKRVLITRVSPGKYSKIKNKLPHHKYYEHGQVIRVGKIPKPKNGYIVPVLTAGTADMPVAEEAAVTLEIMGNSVDKMYDVGVSGVHRLLDQIGKLKSCRVIIVAAGMDGVLPALVGGLVKQPVIAVPTSAGYGASFNGIGPLITMLNSCAPGVTVVNIDNGFGAGYTASLINQL